MRLTNPYTASLPYDLFMLPLEIGILGRLRRRLFPYARGRVLELGVGTGVNLPLYQESVHLLAVDLEYDMLARASRRRRAAQLLCAQADVADLPFADHSFDQVFTSLLFCSVKDPVRGMSEIRRVLRPGGWLTMLEHVRGQNCLTRWITDRLDQSWYRLNGSCHVNRETAQVVQDRGFNIVCSTQHAMGIVQIIMARSQA
jgi:ubiquinone/menaquinone biosynthesis C-methylase UbiE